MGSPTVNQFRIQFDFRKLALYVVSNGGIRPSQNPLVENVIVAAGADEADKWIADHANEGDIVIWSPTTVMLIAR